MTYPRTLAAASTAALFLLTACNSEPVVVGGPADTQAEALKNAPRKALPPSIRHARTYRCKDNSVVYINFLSDDVTANVRDKEEDPPRVTLKAAAAGQPFEGQGPEGQGFKLVGNGETVTYTSPSSGTQSCRA